MGRFNLEFLSQNLFISSLAVLPIGAALEMKKKKSWEIYQLEEKVGRVIAVIMSTRVI